MPTKWLQERGDGSKNEDGIPPLRAFCGGAGSDLHDLLESSVLAHVQNLGLPGKEETSVTTSPDTTFCVPLLWILDVHHKKEDAVRMLDQTPECDTRRSNC